MQKWVIGVDEAGRGPLAGPVSVGVVCIPSNFDWKRIPGVNDSKKLSEKKREELFVLTKKLMQTGVLQYAVCMEDARTIDSIGIVPSVSKAMAKALSKVLKATTCLPDECLVKLDGSLRAPSVFLNQKTIIGGDGTEKVIGLASIMAKVTRDRYMVKIARREGLEKYQFALHKGYGTKVHRNAILENGLSDIHRTSFCGKLLKH